MGGQAANAEEQLSQCEARRPVLVLDRPGRLPEAHISDLIREHSGFEVMPSPRAFSEGRGQDANADRDMKWKATSKRRRNVSSR